jgi:hypothetical protein
MIMKRTKQRVEGTALRRFVILSVFLMMLAAAPVWGDTACKTLVHTEADPVSRGLESIAGL